MAGPKAAGMEDPRMGGALLHWIQGPGKDKGLDLTPETRIPEPENRNPKPENSKTKTRNSKLETTSLFQLQHHPEITTHTPQTRNPELADVQRLARCRNVRETLPRLCIHGTHRH